MTNLTDHLTQARLIVQTPSIAGGRTFPQDMSCTPFREIADELAERSIREFSEKIPSFGLSLADWERLRKAISWRVAHALYEIAFPK